MKQVLVSVITVVFNGERYIEQTISSVLRQDYPNIQYIVIDGGSCDGTISIISKHIDDVDVFISEPDGGIFDAINKGIALAEGCIVGIIHCGDYYEPHAVSAVVRVYQQTGADVIYGNLRVIEEFGSLSSSTILLSDHEKLRKKMAISHPSCFILRSCYLQHGKYDTYFRSISDYELVLRLYLNGAKFVGIPDVLANFRTGGLSGANFALSFGENIEMRRKSLGLGNMTVYAFSTLVQHVYFSTRKYLLQSIIGRERYFRLKKILRDR